MPEQQHSPTISLARKQLIVKKHEQAIAAND